MRWLADECIPARLVRQMRSANIDVSHIAEDSASATDVVVLERAASERRILLTEDRGFGELEFSRRVSGVPGAVLLRLPDDSPETAWPRLQAAIDRFDYELLGDSWLSKLIASESSSYRN